MKAEKKAERRVDVEVEQSQIGWVRQGELLIEAVLCSLDLDCLVNVAIVKMISDLVMPIITRNQYRRFAHHFLACSVPHSRS